MKKQIEKFIKDFQDNDFYMILSKYQNFLDSQKVDKNELLIPKLMPSTSSIQLEFVKKHQELYQRYSDQLF